MEFSAVTPENVHSLTGAEIEHIIKPLFLPDEWEYMSKFDKNRYKLSFILYVISEDRDRYTLPEYLRLKTAQFMAYLNPPAPAPANPPVESVDEEEETTSDEPGESFEVIDANNFLEFHQDDDPFYDVFVVVDLMEEDAESDEETEIW